VQFAPSQSEPYFSRFPVLRFVLVFFFYLILLRILAGCFFPLDIPPSEEPILIELLSFSARLSDVVFLSVWFSAIVLTILDARQIRRRQRSTTGGA